MGDIVLKKLFLIMKKVILSVLVIYAYNKLSLPLDIFIPMNVITIFLVSIFGIPSMLMLILFSLIFV